MLATKQPFAEAMSELPFSLWRFSVAQYEAMIDAGILTENDPVELLEGWIVKKMPKNPAHIFSTQVLQDIFGKILPEGWFINLQDPITTEGSEPEPDAAILRGQRRDYVARKAVPDDVALVIEVAEATLPQDRTIKKRVYAAAGIPVYWIINLPDKQLEVYTNPSAGADGPDYEERKVYRPSDTVPVVINGRRIATIQVADLLP
jgi:Uma2 family endonuclease